MDGDLRLLALLIVGAATALAGCGQDGESTLFDFGGGGSQGLGGSAAGAGGAGGGGHGGAAVYVVPNIDDDDNNGQADWLDPLFAEDNDISVLVVGDLLDDPSTATGPIELHLAGQTEGVRIWLAEQVVLGLTGGGSPALSFSLPASQLSDPLLIEMDQFRRQATLDILPAPSADPIVVQLMAAPLVTNHQLQPAEHAWAVAAGSNGAMLQAFQDALGSRFTVVNNQDIWIQDELEWATATAPDQRLDVAMDSIRDRGLDPWVKGLKAPDMQPITWGIAGTQTTEDKFGNLETTPPHTGGGIEYPLGRIYFGATATVGPTEILQSFLDAQGVQAPLRVDTEWLCIGHVDEFMSFIPDPSSAKGFKLIYADTAAGYAVLDAMSPTTPLQHYASLHGYATAGALAADNALRTLNQDVQHDHLDPILAQLMTEMDLGEEDVIRLPSLFERVSGCAYSSAFMEVAALMPGMVNFTVVNVEGEPIKLFMPDPFMRSDGQGQAVDPMITAVQGLMPSGIELHFVDDWWTYHAGYGEVHCGTNVSRTPTVAWWQEALHLIDGGSP